MVPQVANNLRQGPYHVECTGSRPITEVKQRRARSVPGWVTAWEHRVHLASFSFFPSPLLNWVRFGLNAQLEIKKKKTNFLSIISKIFFFRVHLFYLTTVSHTF